jgi:hypothetical protein
MIRKTKHPTNAQRGEFLTAVAYENALKMENNPRKRPTKSNPSVSKRRITGGKKQKEQLQELASIISPESLSPH